MLEKDKEVLPDAKKCIHCTRLCCSYGNTECLKCYIGHTYSNMVMRCNRLKTYTGRKPEMKRKEFVMWGLVTLRSGMTKPSIDRKNNDLGYTWANIRWIESGRNSMGINKDLPIDERICFLCNNVYKRSILTRSYCKGCIKKKEKLRKRLGRDWKRTMNRIKKEVKVGGGLDMFGEK